MLKHLKDCVIGAARMRSSTWNDCTLELCKMIACDVRSSMFKTCVLAHTDWGLGGQHACDLNGVSFVNTSVDAAVADATMVMHYPAAPAAATY